MVVFALIALVVMSGCNGGAMGDDASAETETDGTGETAAEQPQEPRGNTPGNINQSGFVATSDGWVYFSMPDDERLIKMRSGGNEKQVLVEEDASSITGIQYINVIGDWLYFTSGSDIVKVQTDGSERTVIEPHAGAMYLNVVGDWIYYSAALGGGIYKIRVDGEDKTKVCDESAFSINVFGDWVYFINTDDDWRPYKVNIDGSGLNRLLGTEVLELQYYERALYFTTNNLTISRVSVDGGSSLEIDEHPVTSGFIIDDGWIYHLIRVDMSRNFSLLRMDPESGETEIIQELELFDESERGTIISNFSISDGWVYIYGKALDDDYEAVDEAIFRVRTDGSGLERVIDPETEL